MTIICALCGTPLTPTDMSVDKNKLADGGYLCAECFTKAITINRDLINNLDQFYFAEITGMILKSKIDASQNSGSQSMANSRYQYDAPTRLDEIKDQIVGLNARLSVFANEEVNELANVLDRDEKLLAIAEGIDVQSNREGIIFSTQKRVAFIDKKFLGGVVKNEFLIQDVSSIDLDENLLYSILKINTYRGSAEFKLHNKNDGRAFSSVQSRSTTYTENEFMQNSSPFQAFTQKIPDLVQENVYSKDQVDSDAIFEQLEKLGKLREVGVLTDEEFAEQKKKLLDKL
ncbi:MULTISPECIES: SHOCT domain-containing protein [unclassified Chryseobacterium]|uniref:SHOCT domain-containing protein n=1 Tax=unclassified Chryseobacterium TaxID=2593645 RepID=UPI000E736937|nr:MULTISPECIES: SHOCT domain-containing protein [unclassified Chryseobacterium]RKE81871.1 putative oligomerization/nucleic acid binding protein [Chryseobacterium sp. AG363]WNI37828.1 PH domain-containing protein [Chryseobacterium sp. SG20098]